MALKLRNILGNGSSSMNHFNMTYELVRKQDIADKIQYLTRNQLINLLYQLDSGDIAQIEEFFQNECSVRN